MFLPVQRDIFNLISAFYIRLPQAYLTNSESLFSSSVKGRKCWLVGELGGEFNVIMHNMKEELKHGILGFPL